MRRYEIAKANRGEFIATTVLFSFFFVFFAAIFIGMVADGGYPSPDELVYEEVTFERYEIRKHKSGRSYLVYIEEYGDELEIDSIVAINKVDKEILDGLRAGDRVTVSHDEDGDVYSMAYGDSYILSYEGFLSAHESNDRLGMIIMPILLCLSVGLLVGNCLLWKKTGKSIK